MGMYPPTTGNSLSAGEQASLAEGRGLPAMKVRNAESINDVMGGDALPLGFVSIPIYSHMEAEMLDDLNLAGCEYVNEVDGYNFPADSTYTSVDYLLQDLRAPISDCFNLTMEEEITMDFMGLYGWCDVIQSREFEGVPLGCDLTEEELSMVNQTVLATLTMPLADPILSRDMYVSKQLRKPLLMMKMITEGFKPDHSLKFLGYSAHDWTVAQHMTFLQAANGNFTVVPFASVIQYELHSTEECASEDCFWIEVIYNSEPYLFDQCETPAKCTLAEFVEVMDLDLFVHTSSRYQDECNTPWSPPSTK